MFIDSDTAAEMLAAHVLRVQPAHCWLWKDVAKG